MEQKVGKQIELISDSISCGGGASNINSTSSGCDQSPVCDTSNRNIQYFDPYLKVLNIRGFLS